MFKNVSIVLECAIPGSGASIHGLILNQEILTPPDSLFFQMIGQGLSYELSKGLACPSRKEYG